MNYETVVITGASSGVGAALAHHFARAGKQVYALARSAANLATLAATGNGHIHPIAVDVTDHPAVINAFAQIEAQHPIDVLINNAAVYHRSPFAQQDLSRINAILDTNIKGTIYPTQAILPGMISRQRGRIIQINSVAGTRGIPNEAIYCASKHAIVGFSEALMQELIPHNIQVAVINPGGINTPLWTTNGNSYPGDKSKLIEPDEVAELVAYILAAPDRTIFKKVVFFPTGEWH
ncbi:MAG: SDR family oxidoreductase [Phycisphaerae bacterium]